MRPAGGLKAVQTSFDMKKLYTKTGTIEDTVLYSVQLPIFKLQAIINCERR